MVTTAPAIGADPEAMSNSLRLRLTALATAGFAATTLLGSAIGPTIAADVAVRLEVLSHHALLGNATYVCRMLSFVLVTPAMVGALRLLPRRGALLGTIGAALLLISQVAGAAATTIMAVQIDVLAPTADRQAAVVAGEWLDQSLLWQLSGAVYVTGWLLGFLMLGIALWRAATLPRWAAACIGLGPIVHIAGGDLSWTVVGGAVLLALGLIMLALAPFHSNRRPADVTSTPPTTLDPAELIVSADDARP